MNVRFSLFLVALLFSVNIYSQFTWSDEIPGPNGGYPRMAQMTDGTLLMGVDAAEGIKIFKSTNGGDSWILKSIAVSNSDIPENYSVGNVFLYVISDTEILCAYRLINDHDYFSDVDDGINDYSLHVTKSSDGGVSWSYLSEIVHTGSPIPDAQARPGGVWEPFLMEKGGKLLVFYAKEDARPGPGDTQKIIMKSSIDNGSSWSSEIIVAQAAGSRDGMPGVIETASGQLICTFEAQDNSNGNIFGIKTISSDDRGQTWHSRNTVYNYPTSGTYGAGAPYIVKMGNEDLVISFQHGNELASCKFGYIISNNSGATWSGAFNLFDTPSLWNSLFVDRGNTLYGLTSGVKYKKYFPFGTEPIYNGEPFYLASVQSDKVLGMAESTLSNGNVVNLYTNDNADNKKWTLHDEGNGYFSLSPLLNPGKRLSVEPSASQGSKLHIWDAGGDNQQWYVIEESGNYKLVNRVSGNVMDILSNETVDGTQAVLWESLGKENQQFFTLMGNGSQINPFAPFVKNPGYKIVNKQSGKVIDVSGPSDVDGTNIHQWDYLNAANQKWTINKVENKYFWLEPEHAPGKCLNLDGFSSNDGVNITLWSFDGNSNKQWKAVEDTNGYISLINRLTGKAADVSGSSVDNGANIQQWTPLDSDNQKWTFVPTESCYPQNPLLSMLYPERISLNPGVIGDSQEIAEDENPAPFISEKSAVGNGTISYQWQYTYTPDDEASWINIDGATSESYTSPNLGGLSDTDFEIFARRKATDEFYESYSNSVSIKVSVVTTSLEEELKETLKIFPNPVITEINIETSQFYKVKIYSANGVLQYKGTLNASMNNTIDLSFINPGVYFILFENDTSNVIRTFVKN